MDENLKQLFLKDLCTRLPYGVKVNFSNTECILSNIGNDGSISLLKSDKRAIYATNIQYIKPYLRPMSSMTGEERSYYEDKWFEGYHVKHGDDMVSESEIPSYIDWLNAHHLDYRGLIEKGLALEASNGMYEEE